MLHGDFVSGVRSSYPEVSDVHRRVLGIIARNCRKTSDRRLINAVAKFNFYGAGSFRNRIACELETLGLVGHVWTAHGWEWCIRPAGRVLLKKETHHGAR